MSILKIQDEGITSSYGMKSHRARGHDSHDMSALAEISRCGSVDIHIACFKWARAAPTAVRLKLVIAPTLTGDRN